MRLIRSMRLTASVRLIVRAYAFKAGLSTACIAHVSLVFNCLDRDRRVCYGECRLRTSHLQERLASSMGRAAHS